MNVSMGENEKPKIPQVGLPGIEQNELFTFEKF